MMNHTMYTHRSLKLCISGSSLRVPAGSDRMFTGHSTAHALPECYVPIADSELNPIRN